MKTIVLIACASVKRHQRARAEDLYVSALFRGNLLYAKRRKPDAIYILSAKYGLLELDRVIEPYDTTLREVSAEKKRAWADGVLVQLRRHTDLERDYFILLAGDAYRRYLIPHIAFYEIPLHGMAIGKQLHYLAAQRNDNHLP